VGKKIGLFTEDFPEAKYCVGVRGRHQSTFRFSES